MTPSTPSTSFPAMATSGPNQPIPGPSSASAPQSQPFPSNSDQTTWDGDEMSASLLSLSFTLPTYPISRLTSRVFLFPLCRFNIFLLDYCKKRGYHKAASQLVTEADIPPESEPPINAQQGLLFESVSLRLSLYLVSDPGSPLGGGVSSGCYFKPKTAAMDQTMQCSTIRSVSSSSFISEPTSHSL